MTRAMKKRTTWYSVYARYPDGERVELMKFKNEKTATVYARKCAAQNAGMSFDVCEVKLLTTFRTEAK